MDESFADKGITQSDMLIKSFIRSNNFLIIIKFHDWIVIEKELPVRMFHALVK